MTVHVPAPIQESRTVTPNDQAPAMLPCPWCGEPLTEPVSVSEGSTFRWRKVDGCCTDGPEIRHNTMADDQAAAEVESRAEAIAAWNKRAAIAALHACGRAEAVAWPSEAKRAVDGDGWAATSAISLHRMSADQARVWNGCRAACIAAHGRAAPPAPTHDALRESLDLAKSHLGQLFINDITDGVEQTKAHIAKLTALLAQEPTDGA